MTAQRVEKLRESLAQEMPEAMALLRRMVEINSFTRNVVGVNALGELTAEAFAPLGFRAEYVDCESGPYGRHLVLVRPGTSGRMIGMVGHLDTVFTAEEELKNAFYWREEAHDGLTRIYGPGTVDIKGGTIVMYMMLTVLQQHMPEVFEKVTWMILLNAAEEEFVPDFHDLCRERLIRDKTLACLVFEGGRMSGREFQAVVARKGMARYKIHVTGRGAHAGAAHQMGASALVQMAEVVQRVADLTDYDRDLTFNVGVMQSGTVVNRVPHQADAEVEFRTFEPDVFTEAMISMQSLDRYSTVKSPQDGFACQTRVQKTQQFSPWPRNNGTDRLLSCWQAAADEMGYVVRPEARGGLSDGNALWAHVPTLDGMGPAGGNGHCSERSPDGSKDQEYAVKDSFVPKALLNVLGILYLLEEL